MKSTLRSASLRAFISLLLSYAVVVSFASPLLTKRVSATALTTSGSTNVPRTGLTTTSLSQAAEQRQGELLIRFRSGVTAQNRETILASHGVRSKKQLRGDSGVEKLEVISGQDPDTVAQIMLLQPEVEFAEPNFLIKKDQLITSDPQFGDQWALRNIGQEGGQFGSDINVTTAWQN